MPTAVMTADQLEILGALKDVQGRIKAREAEQTTDLEWRSKLVERGRDLGLTQAFIAAHINVKPSALGQAALRDRRRVTTSV